MSSPMAVIWNPTAGSAENAEAARRLLQRHMGCRVVETRSADHARELAAEAAENDGCLVLAAGGDGTVNAVLQGVMTNPERVNFGVLPLGTGNDLCRSLGIPLDPLQAAEFYTSQEPPPVRRIDVARLQTAARSQFFANMATAGNTGRYTGMLSTEAKAFWGPFCYVRGVVDCQFAPKTSH